MKNTKQQPSRKGEPISKLISSNRELASQGRYSQAQALFKKVLARVPRQEEAWEQWVIALQESNKAAQALEVLKCWLENCPNSYQGHILEGRLYSNLGDQKQSIKSFAQALRICPEAEAAYADLSIVMIRLHRYEAAVSYLDKVLDINAKSVTSLGRKGQILWLMGDWRMASECYREAASLKPDSAIYLLNQYLIIPGIPADSHEIEESRQQFLKGLSIAEKDSSIKLDFRDEALPHTFELAYHNKEDCWLLERYISLMRTLFSPHLKECQNQHGIKSSNIVAIEHRRVRIGFLSRFFSAHSNALAFEGLIRNLDRERFEVILIHAPNSIADSARSKLERYCSHTVQLTTDVPDSYRVLLSIDLDILYFTDLGMNANDYILPLLRAAPIQMTGWGIPHTSGIREIDYYISSAGLEGAESDLHYSETLIRMPGGIPCCFETQELYFEALPREYFLLPPLDTLVGCLQGLHKIHPDFDRVMERVSLLNPELKFVFIEDSVNSRTELFLERLSRTAPSVRERCVTLAIMTRSEYHALCKCIDFLLDPIYYGCGISFFEASFVGTPIVTLEGDRLRSRVVACGYREMEVAEPPIAKSLPEYIDIASSLAESPNYREMLRSAILSKRHLIFNRLDYVRNFESFCIKAAKVAKRAH